MKESKNLQYFKGNKGQSLVEIIISLTIGAILIVAATVTIVPTLRSNLESKNIQIANSLAQEYLDNLQNLSESNWLNIYSPAASKGANSQFYLRMAPISYSAGYNSPAILVNDNSTGAVAWSNPGNAAANDNAYATAGLTSSQISNYLKATNLGFSIPTGATINGIEATVERKADGIDVQDNRVRIVKNGSISFTDNASSNYWPASDAIATYGGSSDLWGETWTPADINSSNFGIAVSAQGSATAYIDQVQLKVYYASSTSGGGASNQIFSGNTSTTIQNLTFTRYFSIENTSRDSCGIGNVTTSATTTCFSGPGSSGVFDDPSTQKITVTVSWQNGRSISRSQYLTRSRNKIFNQNDWSGGPGQEGPITLENNKFATSSSDDYGGYIGSLLIQGLSATSSGLYGTSIDSVYRYAWNDIIGWLDFYSTQTVNVGATQLYGYATSSVGYIALDCGTSPNGNICSNSNFQILNDIHSEGQGNNDRGFLSGYAWNDAIGWISFDSDTSGSPHSYQVRIKGNGDFTGWAWNDIVGWISFNCNDVNCDYSYKVKSSWASAGVPFVSTLTSSIFDTQATSGVAINTIMWQGNQPADTSVKFQIASVNYLTGGTGLIDTTYRYAWADTIGWIDFGWPAGNVNVGTTQLTGYAYNSIIGQIALDCATAPGGNICSQSNFRVSRNSSNGNLSGWAWNDNVGWISFSSENNSTPITCNPSDGFGAGEYCVTVNPTTGTFTGWAWNDYVGWISVNCADSGLCGSSNYWVNTRTAATWDYKGPDGTNTSYYSSLGPSIPVQINLGYHNNQRYFRYKIFLYSDADQTVSPRVDDIIINYSP